NGPATCRALWWKGKENRAAFTAPPELSSLRRNHPGGLGLGVLGGFFLLLVTGEEGRKRRDGFAVLGVGRGGLIAIHHAQRLGQPAGFGQQAFGFLGHVALLQVPDQVG